MAESRSSAAEIASVDDAIQKDKPGRSILVNLAAPYMMARKLPLSIIRRSIKAAG
jgi:hypothetical protein